MFNNQPGQRKKTVSWEYWAARLFTKSINYYHMEKYYNYLQKALDYIQSAEYVIEDRGKRKLL